MNLDDKTKELLNVLKARYSAKNNDKDCVIGIVLCCDESGAYEPVIEYCNEHPDADYNEILAYAFALSDVVSKGEDE